MKGWRGKPAQRINRLKKWAKIAVGDIIILHDEDKIPADILVLKVSESNGEAFVKTANLDGESSLKRKTAVLQDKL